MDSVILMTPTDVTIEDLAQACASFRDVPRLADDRLYVELADGNQHAWIDPDGPETVEFEDKELTLARQLFGTFKFFSIRYHEVSVVNLVLRAILESVPAVVDNDFDLIISGEEFLGRLDQNPEWDWQDDFLRLHDPD